MQKEITSQDQVIEENKDIVDKESQDSLEQIEPKLSHCTGCGVKLQTDSED